MEMQYYLFFILLGASAFTLRGIWGHQIGGAVMGMLMGLGVSIIYDLSYLLSLKLVFWQAIIWAFCATFGWASHKTASRFFRGYLIYGAPPNFVLGMILFPGNWGAIFSIALLGGLGMGMGFGVSYGLLKKLRENMAISYKKKYPDSKPLNWGTNPITKDEISHIFVFRFDTWKICLEMLSGGLFAITTLLAFSLTPEINISEIAPVEITCGHNFMIFVSYILIPGGLILGIVDQKRHYPSWILKEEYTPWGIKMIKKSIFNWYYLNVNLGHILLYLSSTIT